MDLEKQFRHGLRSLGVERTRLLVAVSGGGDSVALLELLAGCASALELSLTVAHVDHGIAATSGAVARDVYRLAERHRLPFVVTSLELGAGASETAARAGRWSALEEMRLASAADFIVTAHHFDDQAETVLMRVLRGTGPAGLAGMQPRAGAILRPLLPFRREELARYLHERGLACWADPANEDVQHDRTWVRQRLLPLLQERWPDVTRELNRVATQARQWRGAWDSALSHLSGLDLRPEQHGISVAGGALAGYSSEMARAVMRALGLRAGVVMSESSAERALQLAARGQSGRWVPLGGGWRAASAFGRVHITRPEPSPESVVLEPEAGETRWGEWTFRLTREMAPLEQDRRAMTAWLSPGAVVIRSRKAGDRLQPLGGPGHRTVARLLQEARIPLERRRSWPLIEFDGAPVWIPGICRGQHAVPDPGTEALRIDADHR
jgi:tRNA(Ile)-lysidine synthase